MAKPFGVTYEALTGDYSEVNFSSARLARIGYWSKVEDWRWQMLTPRMLDPVWGWAMEAALVAGLPVVQSTEWTAPALPMIEPDREGLAYQRNIRTGVMTLSEAQRVRGYNPGAFLREMADDWKRVDKLGLVLDCDPRRVTQAGQLHQNVPSPVAEEPPVEPAPDGEEEDGPDETDDDDEDDAESDEDEEEGQE
jgi:capsid protein